MIHFRFISLFALGATIESMPSEAANSTFEGRAVIAAGSLNPPSPIEGCNRAKRDAEQKASGAGTKRLVSWVRLSRDSDCSLSTTRAGSLGYYYIFTARGTFAN